MSQQRGVSRAARQQNRAIRLLVHGLPNLPQLLVATVKELYGLFDRFTHAFLTRRAGSLYWVGDRFSEIVLGLLGLQFAGE